ncbi:hypothetical protein H2200_001406 [Cladophialophora chaetospira]|uniref:tRNA (adenine(58)-N(1))-methyltransferase catalytic subunit TRM61 n=1 Tax=Cladophialophora chaetospira TaxID=386627 RepID=A0AA38XKX8_9EURO|nr:hypothetical protein H2200_001406 [Cladophialophora chaetospira]
MSGLFRFLGKVLGISASQPAVGKSAASILQNATIRDLTRFAEGDRVLIDRAKLTFPLAKNAKFDLSKGQLPFNDVIGKPVRSTFVRSSKGSLHRVELPSLEEYVNLTPRIVTPVYSSYASTIVSLLDIHPEPFNPMQSNDASSRIEILEAGTGHGSLTLHLARAIAAANPPPPTAELPRIRTPDRPFLQGKKDLNPDALAQAWTEWKKTRRAVIHTVEAVPSNSIQAEKIVHGFRRGLYWPHVDFYASDVKEWLGERPHDNTATEEYLDYVCLDMPGVHEQLKHVAPAMRDGAKLVVFVPSITQIGDCVRAISEERLPLEVIKTVELGEGISTGRKWGVRFVKPRKSRAPVINGDTKKTIVGAEVPEESNETDGDTESTTEDIREDEEERLPTPTDDAPVMVCRPLVGERTFGGGFIALLTKVSPASAALSVEWRQGQTGRARKRSR